MSTWDSRALKGAPVNADEILIIDTQDSRNQKRAIVASIPFGITTSNVGLGEGLALLPVVNDFPFKSLIGTSPIVVTGNANDITFSLNALTNADLAVGAFANITGLGVQTQALDMDGNTIVLDADGDSSISASVDDQISFQTTGTERMRIEDNTIEMFDVLRMNGNAVSLSPLGSTSVSSAAGEQILSFNVNGASAVFFQLSGSTFNLPITMNAVGISNATFIESNATNPADAGFTRLAVTDSHAWRNNANDGNTLLGINATDELIYDGDVISGLYDLSNATGIISGDLPVPSATVGSVDLSEMKLLFVDHTNPVNPTRKVITITAQTLVNPLIASETVTRLWVDEFGSFTWTSFTTELDRRQFILLGTPQHFDNVNITGVGTAFKIQTSNEGWLPIDLTDMIGLIKNGMSVSGRGADLGIDIGTGRVFLRTSNQQTNQNSQNIITYATNTLQPALNHHIRTGTTISTSNFLEPTLWDDGGVEATVSNNNFTNIRIWIFPVATNSLFAITQRGQKEYGSLSEAEAGAVTDSYELNPILEANDIGLAIISIKENATNTLPDGINVSILNVNKFGFIGNAGGGSGGGGAGQSPIAQDVEYAGFDIKNISNVEFQNTTGAPAVTTAAIWYDGLDMIFNVPTNDEYSWKRNGVDVMILTPTGLDLLNSKITGVSKIHSNIGLNEDDGFINMSDSELVSWESTFLDTTNTIGFNNDIFEITYETVLRYTFGDLAGFQSQRRIQGFKGPDVASATTLVLGDGNVFFVLGTTEIETIDATDWQAGAEITLEFSQAVTIKEMIGNIFLTGAIDHTTVAGEIIKFFYTGSFWTQMTTNVPAGGGATDLNSLADVAITGFTINDLLVSDVEGTWVNRGGVFTGISGLGAQSQALNMNNRAVDNFSALIQNGVSLSTGAIRLLNDAAIRFEDNSGSLAGFIEYDTNEDWRLGIANVLKYRFTINEFDLIGNSIIRTNFIQFNAGTPADVGELRFGDSNKASWRNLADTDNHSIAFVSDEFKITHNGIDQYSMNDARFDMMANSLQNALFVQSEDPDAASAGFVRMGVLGDVGWRNNANNGNLLLSVNASDQLTFDGAVLGTETSVTAIAQYTNTDTTTNLNVVTPIELPIFGTQEILDTGFTLVGQTLRCDFTGTVLVHCNVWAGLDTAGFRTNFQLEVRKNSTTEAGVSQGDYIRNTDGNNRASTSITKYVEVVTNDTISIMAGRGATIITDAVSMKVAGNSFISVTRVK